MASPEILGFAGFTLDVAERRLLHGTEAVRLSPKAFDLLAVLVRERGRLVRKDELLQRVWPESFVEEGILTVHVSALRKALGDNARPPACIETVARSGYRFIAPVTRESADDGASALRAMARPVELYEFVGRGRSHLLSGSYFDVPDAVAAFRAAIALDSTYAPAHAGLALSRCAEAGLRAAPYQEAFAEAKDSALKALAMDSGSRTRRLRSAPSCSSAIGTGRLRNAAFAARWTSILIIRRRCSSTGRCRKRWDGSRRGFDSSSRRSPAIRARHLCWCKSPFRTGINATTTRRSSGRSAPSTLDPKHLLAGEFLAGVYWKLGDLDSWLGESRRRAIVFGAPREALAQLDHAGAEMRRIHARGGRAALARHMAEIVTAQAHAPGAGQKMALQCAILCGAAGRVDDAFEHLDRALAAGDPALVHLAVAPQWDSLRADPRFAERLRRMALPVAA
jgi:DNA-binding winged helix-turn-helix (wHTH) protein